MILSGVFCLLCSILLSLNPFRKQQNQNDHESIEKMDHLLCRFVVDGTGHHIGESIAVDDDLLIIKSKNRFLGVPLKHVEDSSKNILVKGLVDIQKAYMLGEKWRQQSILPKNDTLSSK